MVDPSQIPDVVHDHPVNFLSPSLHCADCGNTVCYVDGCTYSHGDKDPALLSATLSTQYKRISSYMTANKLVINDDKTHLVAMGTKATAARRDEGDTSSGQPGQRSYWVGTFVRTLSGRNIFRRMISHW